MTPLTLCVRLQMCAQANGLKVTAADTIIADIKAHTVPLTVHHVAMCEVAVRPRRPVQRATCLRPAHLAEVHARERPPLPLLCAAH